MRRFWPGSSATWIQKILPDKGRIFLPGPVPGAVGGGHRSSLLSFPPEQENDRAQGKLRQKQPQRHGRKACIASKGQDKLRGVDGSQGNIPIAVLRELPLKDRLRQEGIAFRGSGFRQPVKNVVSPMVMLRPENRAVPSSPVTRTPSVNPAEVQPLRVGREPSSRKVTDFQFLPSWLYSNKKETPARGLPSGSTFLT